MPYVAGPVVCDHCGDEVTEKSVIWNTKTKKYYCAKKEECREASIK